VSTQLDQILNYLDRDGVTEVILAVGQPIQLRRSGALVPLTAAQLTRVQISALIANTPLAAVFGKRGEGDVQLGNRALKVTASGTAETPTLTIARPTLAAPAPISRGPAGAPAITERTRATAARGPTTSHDTRSRTPAPPAHPAEHIAQPRAAIPTVPDTDKVVPTGGSRLTRSDVKFGPPTARDGYDSMPLDLDPFSAGVELEPPLVDLGARSPSSLSLDLDDRDGIELGLPGPTPHHGSTPAIDAAFGAPFGRAQRTASPTASGPPPALDDFGPRVSSAARPQPVAAAPVAARAQIPGPATGPAAGPPALRALLQEAARRGASDLHVVVHRPVCVRVRGELTPLHPDVLAPADVEALLLPLLDERGRAQLEGSGYSDLAIDLPGGGRSRSNIARCQGGLRGTFRIGRATPASLDELGLPKELAKIVSHHQGLVVISGPSGHGKTTTLAALVDLINTASAFHIITVEDPIEIVYPRKAAVVSQREVGAHTRSFAAALKGSLREDPDVIVIGELRDRETVEIALTAAETGHLVLATMSTPSAAKTIDRLVDMFPPNDQSQVRASIAGALRAILSQRLLPTIAGDGVVAAVELVTGVLPLAAMIRDDKLFQLPSLMQRGRAFGMIRLDDSLSELVRSGKVSSETALAASENRKELASRLQAGTAAIPSLGRKP